MDDIKNKTIAIVGVSVNKNKFGHKIFKDLAENGFNVYGIGKKKIIMYGKNVFTKLQDINSKIDMIITVVPPAITENVVEEAKKLGVKEIWMQPGSESEDAVNKAGEYGINVVKNLCFMVMNGIW